MMSPPRGKSSARWNSTFATMPTNLGDRSSRQIQQHLYDLRPGHVKWVAPVLPFAGDGQ